MLLDSIRLPLCTPSWETQPRNFAQTISGWNGWVLLATAHIPAQSGNRGERGVQLCTPDPARQGWGWDHDLRLASHDHCINELWSGTAAAKHRGLTSDHPRKDENTNLD